MKGGLLNHSGQRCHYIQFQSLSHKERGGRQKGVLKGVRKMHSLKISAVAAHYSPPPASQTIKLGKTPLGITLNNSCYSDGVQTPSFHGFQKMHIFALQTSPRTKSFGANILPPFFFAQWVRLDLKCTWEQKNGGKLCLDILFCTHVTIVS